MRSNRLPTVWALLLATSAAFTQSPATATMHVNNVQAKFQADATLFNDGQQGQFVPMEAGLAQKTLMRHSGIWMVGMDPGLNLKGSVSVNNRSNFQPGGLTQETPFIYDFNKIWKVSCADIQQHLAGYQDNGIVDNPDAALFGFPSQGNSFFEQYNPGLPLPFTPQGLAGFYDSTQDATYDPDKGEYPSMEVRGCALNRYPEEQSWFVFHDRAVHPSSLAPLNMEIQAQVFAYKTPQPSLLNNAVFVRYKLINRSDDLLDSCFVGIYSDFDIGNPDDDFIDCIPDRQIMYGYNGDTNDEDGFGSSVPCNTNWMVVNFVIYETNYFFFCNYTAALKCFLPYDLGEVRGL